MNRGSMQRSLTDAAKADASMRPRFMNRGSWYRKIDDVWVLQASMRPRFMNRGSLRVPDDQRE